MSFHDFYIIISYIEFAVWIVALFGNILSFIVFSRDSFAQNSINVYCRAMSIFDSFIIINIVDYFYSRILNNQIFLTSMLMCKMNNYLVLSMSSITEWVLVMFSFDKMICVTQMTKFSFFKKPKFQVCMITVITLINLAIYTPVPVWINFELYPMGHNSSIFACSIDTVPFFKTIGMIYLIESTLVPFALFMLTTFVIIIAIYKSSKNLQRTISFTQQYKHRRAKDRKFAFNSIVLNLLFIIFKLPISLCFIVDLGQNELSYFVIIMSEFAFFLNPCTRFFSYLLINSIFRRELVLLLRLDRFFRIVKGSSAVAK